MAPNSPWFGLNGVPSQNSNKSQATPQKNIKNPHFDKEAVQCGLVMCTIIQKWWISQAFENMKDKGGWCLHDDGKEMCHTFHLRGNCSSNCCFQSDHGKQLSSEAARLLAWDKQAYSWKIGRQQSKLIVAVPASSISSLQKLLEHLIHWVLCFAYSYAGFPSHSIFEVSWTF